LKNIVATFIAYFFYLIVHCNSTFNLIYEDSDCHISVYRDFCRFQCHQGYAGPHNNQYFYKSCLGDGNWRGGNPVCYPRKCSSSPPNSTAQVFETSCVPHYKLGCATLCRYGYSGIGGYYTCELFNAGYTSEYVKWVGETTCTLGMYTMLMYNDTYIVCMYVT